MNKRLLTPLIILLILSVSFQACRPRRVISPAVDEMLRSPDRAIRAMHANHANFSFYSTRFSGTALWENNSYNISGTLRIQKDQAIFISVTPLLGIEVARILVTPDSVKFVNRLESSYFVGDIGFINRMLGANLDFFMLQAILTGNDFEHFTNDNFRVVSDREMLLLSSPARRPSNNRREAPIEHNLWLDPTTFRIKQNIAYDAANKRMIRADYKSHERLDGQLLPNEVVLLFTDAANRAELSYRTSRTSLNNPQDLTFSIPSRYKPIDF